MDWSVESPDVNLIEYAWALMKQQLCSDHQLCVKFIRLYGNRYAAMSKIMDSGLHVAYGQCIHVWSILEEFCHNTFSSMRPIKKISRLLYDTTPF